MGIISCRIMPGKSSGTRACPCTCFFLLGLMSLAWGQVVQSRHTYEARTAYARRASPAFQLLLMHATKYDKSYPPMPFLGGSSLCYDVVVNGKLGPY